MNCLFMQPGYILVHFKNKRATDEFCWSKLPEDNCGFISITVLSTKYYQGSFKFTIRYQFKKCTVFLRYIQYSLVNYQKVK